METFYLIDFENVHNEGIENLENITKNDHVHIFSTQNALNIRNDIFWMNGDIKPHLVPIRKQSLDMHLVSYLGYLLGVHGKNCTYVIVSKDKDYDNIIKFWKEEGYSNISRKENLLGTVTTQKKTEQVAVQVKNDTQHAKDKISSVLGCEMKGTDRSELNNYMQHALLERGYPANEANRICKYVIAHCNDDRMLNSIHNDIKNDTCLGESHEYATVYGDVKDILKTFTASKSNSDKKEAQIRSFFGQHFKKNIYKDCKEEIIDILLNAKTKMQVNNDLLKLYSDGNVVKHIYTTVQPLIKDLPGK